MEYLHRRQTALGHLFDAVYLMDEKGLVIAEHPEDYHQAGLNVSDREDGFRTNWPRKGSQTANAPTASLP